MTDEELKEKAEKYFDNIGKECGYDKEFEETGKRHYWIGLDIKKAYIAGAKENDNEVIWHNLQKNPEDLPSDNRTVLDEAGDRFYYFRGHFYYESDSRFDCQPIAWCEIPTYEDKE